MTQSIKMSDNKKEKYKISWGIAGTQEVKSEIIEACSEDEAEEYAKDNWYEDNCMDYWAELKHEGVQKGAE